MLPKLKLNTNRYAVLILKKLKVILEIAADTHKVQYALQIPEKPYSP